MRPLLVPRRAACIHCRRLPARIPYRVPHQPILPVATKSPSRVPPGAFTLIFLVCLGLLGFALYLQHLENLDPCPWCIVQRLGFILIALVCLTGALHRPGPAGTTFYSILGALVAGTGAAAAAYHIQLQNDPQRALQCMGGWLENWLDAARLGKMVPPLLQYEGSCVLKPWSFLGLSIPGWSLTWFLILLAAFIAMAVMARR